MAANREDLESLHTKLTEFWAARVKEAAIDPEKPLTAAEATAVAKFLKDNNVTAIISASTPGKNILADLPFKTEEVVEDAYH